MDLRKSEDFLTVVNTSDAIAAQLRLQYTSVAKSAKIARSSEKKRYGFLPKNAIPAPRKRQVI
jgi:hypothetical protein